MDETRWHHHWYIEVHEQGRIYRFLRKPRLQTTSKDRADRSIFAWYPRQHPHGTVYSLSILGILHGLTGLTLRWVDDVDD